MPLYEYVCEACGTRFEQIRKFSDPPVEKCPACGGTVQKLMSLPAFQFKGTGWYVTDYARKGQNAENSGTSAENSGKSAENNAKSSDASEPGQRDKSSPSATSTSSSTPSTTSTGSSSSES